MAQWVKYLLYKHKDLSSVPKGHIRMAAHASTCLYPSTGAADIGSKLWDSLTIWSGHQLA